MRKILHQRGTKKRFMPKTRPGISLLFAMTIVSVSFLIMIGSISLATDTLKNTRSTSYRLDAYYAALSGLEEAGWTVANQTANGVTGYQTSDDIADVTDVNLTSWDTFDIDYDADGAYDPGDSTVYYYVAGQSGPLASNTSYIYNPLPGTGTAGVVNGEDCSIFSPPSLEDDPCSWNKLEVGDIASIPLYYTTDGTTVENPADHSSDFNTFELYIRTPCEWSGSACTGTDAKSDSDEVVNWQITAECDEDGDGTYESTCYLIPYDGGGSANSKIEEKNINNTNSKVLESSNSDEGQTKNVGEELKIIEFITDSTMQKPLLRISIIDTIQYTSGGTVPYLEYHLKTANADAITGNAEIVLVAKGFGGPTGNFEQTLTRSLGRSTNIVQFVINN